ncbi:PTS sugar transporter subunit IIB [Paenibacillus sp. FA6]|uniref:PTS sugar transporter subunit IIB n=1 Tax=Paenibacillus sp. FA6 TaxID=3413029 RepID=UPI003F65EC39
MRKIIVVCNSGLGTSMMIRLNVEALLKEFGVKAWVEHTDVTSMDAHDADLIIGSSYIMDSLDSITGIEMIGLEDVIDRKYLRTRLTESIIFQRWVG